LKDAIRSHYDQMAGLYRIFWGDHLHHGLFLKGNESPAEAQLRMLDYCADLIRIPPGARVLDAGCGHGGTSWYLSKHFNCRVTGVTLSSQQAALARAAVSDGGGHDVDFVIADLEECEFPASSFDVVWVMESSEHFFDRQAFFNKAARTLAPGGTLLVAAWTGAPQHPLVQQVSARFLCPPLQESFEYCRQIEGAGMSVFSQRELTDQVSQTWEICRSRAQRSRLLLPMLPSEAREFVSAMDVILRAYQSGALHYSVIAARRSMHDQT
jgi:tocopherol O-methyltransferase